MPNPLENIATHLREHIQVIERLCVEHLDSISIAGKQIVESLESGGTIFWCGNGGSASDSQHLAAEFVGRFKKNRKALRSIALTADTSVLTCVSNDYSFEEIFSRQLEALARVDDILVVISTSGNSSNVVRVLRSAQHLGVKTIALLGEDGGEALSLVQLPIVISSNSTARIQEAHILIGHILCDLIEKELGLV